jgi:hypothetical protein
MIFGVSHLLKPQKSSPRVKRSERFVGVRVGIGDSTSSTGLISS